MYRNLYIIGIGCLICLGVFLVSFTGSARKRADFVWNNQTEPQTLDPTRMTGQPEGEIAIGLFEGLTAYHPRTMEAVPALAESWEIDGLTYTFHLRPDAWWVKGDKIFEIDGRKRNVTSADIVYAWKRHIYPETGSEYSYVLYHIKGMEEYEKAVIKHWKNLVETYKAEKGYSPRIKKLAPEERQAIESYREEKFRELVKIQTPDDLTLEVTLKSPAPYFPFLTSFYVLFPVPREAIEEHGDGWTRPENIVSNGPYTLKEWKFNSHIRLIKNQNYWERLSMSDQ